MFGFRILVVLFISGVIFFIGRFEDLVRCYVDSIRRYS